MDYELNFDFKTLLGRSVKIYLNDYTEVVGRLALYGMKDRTIVVENFVHRLGEEIFCEGKTMILKENMWCAIAVEPVKK